MIVSDVKITSREQEAIAEMQRKIEQVLQLIGEAAAGHAREDVPVDTGRLRNSIDYVVKENDLYVGTNVEYAKYVEFIDKYKHESGKAHFLRDSVTTNHDEYRAIANAVLKND